MSQRYVRIAVAGCVAVLTATVGATIALAAVTWTVRPGGSISAKSGNLTVADTETGAMFTCVSSLLGGTLKGGTGLPGTGIGTVTAARISECGSLGSFTVTAAGLPWHVSFSSYNATKGVVTGNISHVRFRIRGNAFGCHAVVSGTSGTASDGIARLSYTNRTAVLKAVPTRGNLHFYNVVGCAGIIRTGDHATLRGTFAVSPRQAITSP